MLPGAAPAALRRARASGRMRAVLLFVALYLTIWAVVGVVVYAVYRPHGSAAAGVVVIAAGLYELTPLKRHFRRQCWAASGSDSGIGFGLCCVGSSINLMVIMVALGVMSVTWMAVVAAGAIAQKLWAPRAAIDVPLALAIVGLGLFILIAAPMI
jgi:predicted metal-binding membrane protein